MTTYTYREPSEEWLAFRRRRESLGLSRDALAERSGVYRDSIYNAETGKTKNPHRSTLDQLNRALDDVELERGSVPEPTPEPTPEPEPTPVVTNGVIRVTVEGMFGTDKNMIVEVPAGHAPELHALVDRIMDNLARYQKDADGEADRPPV